jgi:uncharacterized protein
MSVSFKRLGARVPVSPYAEGVFQFGGALHRGALLASLDGIYDWGVGLDGMDEPGLLRFLDEQDEHGGDFLLLGTGPRLLFPTPAFRTEMERRGKGLEAMDTRAACRTYNVLLAEGRLFAAGLLPA